MGVLKKILPYTGLLIFIIIIYKYVNLKSIVEIIKNVNIKFLILAVISTFFIIFFKIIRIYKILTQNNVKISFINFLEIYSNSNLLAQVTNLLFSETTAAVATMYNQENKTRVANIYFLCNLTDLAMISMLCLISLIIKYSLIVKFLDVSLLENFKSFNLFLIIGFILILIIVIFYKKIFHILKDLKALILNSYKTLLKFTLIVYSFYIIACYFDAVTFNIYINIFYLIFVYTLGSLISVVPISINGLGTREALFIFLLNASKVSNEQAFSLSIFAFALAPIFNLFLIYIFVFLKKKCHK